MQRSIRWRDLVVGLLALTGIVALSGAILVFGNVNSLHGRTLNLYAAVASARGVLPGTEVWVEGKKVGLVDDVVFRSASVDSSRRLLIVMEVLDEYRPMIHADSRVQIRSSGSLLGAPVVYVSHGTPASRAVAPGDTLISLPQRDLESVASQFAVASRELPAIMANLKLVAQQLRGAHGTLGALGIEGGGPELAETQERLDWLWTRLGTPTGTVGLARNSRPSLGDRAHNVLARADSIQALVGGDRSAIGRFRRDSTLPREVQSVRDDLEIVESLLRGPQGTLGRAAADSAILRAVGDTRREMTLLFTDMRRNPLRYVHF